MAVVAAFSLGSAGPAPAAECTGYCQERLVQVGLHGRVVQLVADGDSTCALTESGDVYCWGADYPDPYRADSTPLVLATLGALLVAGGAALLLVSRRLPPPRRPGTARRPA
ncbi:hypothetical protein Ari01nite_36810 [Paractinoplanes rishiriensis]|uniref:Uncharacterized protein n=1 Tax=Paractinoplanes rishiriensis TaxID=1050105 RepID=A0A919MQJ3_9ACTN|nr:hypothetical protein Ari01nite_36810 [Actinoplanes rishiriensis]